MKQKYILINIFLKFTGIYSLCTAGYYSTGYGSNNCLICPNGYFCPIGTSNPTPCPPGTWQNTYYDKDRIQCYKCSPGYYTNKTGSSSCLLCPNGHSCCDPSKSPTPCPPGTWQNSYSDKDRIQCWECSPGYTSLQSASSSCSKCSESSPCFSSEPIKCNNNDMKDIEFPRKFLSFKCLNEQVVPINTN